MDVGKQPTKGAKKLQRLEATHSNCRSYQLVLVCGDSDEDAARQKKAPSRQLGIQ